MKSILLVLGLAFLSGCATYGDAFRSEESLRADHFAKLAQRSPEQVKHDQDVSECVGRANAFGGSTPQGHQAVMNACLAQKGL
jgi:hypothetical protein